MASVLPPDVLEHMQSLYPAEASLGSPSEAYIANPWYLVAAVAANAANEPEAVPIVFLAALHGLEAIQNVTGVAGDIAHKQRLQLTRRIREGVLQSGVLCGFPKSINSLVALGAVTPEDLREDALLRDTEKLLASYDADGKALFGAIYSDRAASILAQVTSAYPDLGWVVSAIGYGVMYGGTSVLSQTECSYMQVSALIGADVATQAGWHFANMRRNGVTKEQADAIRAIAMTVAERAGVKWKRPVPEA